MQEGKGATNCRPRMQEKSNFLEGKQRFAALPFLHPRQHLGDRFPHCRWSRADGNAHLLQHRNFFSGALAYRGDDRTGVTHAAALRGGQSSDVGDQRFAHVFFGK